MRYSSLDAQLQGDKNTNESIKIVNKLSDTFFYRLYSGVLALYMCCTYDRSEFINTSPLDHVHGITGAVTSPV